MAEVRPALQEALDAPVHRLVEDIGPYVYLLKTSVEPDVDVDSEKPISECDCRVFEDGACLIVERAVTILAQVLLKHPIVPVSNHRFGTAALAIDAVTAVNLCLQIRGPVLRDERLQWTCFVGWRERDTLARYNF